MESFQITSWNPNVGKTKAQIPKDSPEYHYYRLLGYRFDLSKPRLFVLCLFGRGFQDSGFRFAQLQASDGGGLKVLGFRG